MFVEINPDRPNLFFAACTRPNQGNTKLEAVLSPIVDQLIKKMQQLSFDTDIL